MSLSAAVIDAMLASGCTAEQLAAAVKADLAEQEKKLAAKREKDAERQRNRRSRHAESRDVTRTRRDTADSPPLDKETPPTPPKEINPPLYPPINSDELIPPAEDLDGDRVTADEVVGGWNDLAGRCGLPAIKKLTPDRRRKLASRIREHSLDDWQTAFRAIERSDFLRGKNNRGWRADFDFLLSPSKFVKLIEGHYDHEQAH